MIAQRFVILLLALVLSAAAARAQTAPATDADFHYNHLMTTRYGPADADIWLEPSNFLACRPPSGRPFSYALCFFSGPAVATPVPADGSPSPNPPLPCVLSKDGRSADCTCYSLSTDQYPPIIPYFVDINGILNQDVYLRTVLVCGHSGRNCSLRGTEPPVCRAIDAGRLIPNAELVSVFSPVKSMDYATGQSPNTTSCATGKYAACMTAPCTPTGKKDAAGNDLVQCHCPVHDGPFQVGQAGVPCDANQLTPAAAAASGKTYVWSAAYNPKSDESITPPTKGCMPDGPGSLGCPLYSAGTAYPLGKGSGFCKAVCQSYRNGVAQASAMPPRGGIQTPYACDSTLCTTLGSGMAQPPSVPPAARAQLLGHACAGIAGIAGLETIAAFEAVNHVSCGASQICGCDRPAADINLTTDREIGELNARQQQLGITPQCLLNGTLCGLAK